MMKPKQVLFTPHTPDDDGVCVLQTTAGAGSMLLNGADVVGGVAKFSGAATDYQEIGYQLSLTSTGNISGVTFTIVGTDASGAALSEAIAGPNNNTVETTGYFRTVTSITVGGAVGTNTKIGTVDEFITKTIPLDLYDPRLNVAVNITGTINYTVQGCLQRPTAGETPNWADLIAAGAVDASLTVEDPMGAVRIIGNSFTGGAIVSAHLTQPRFH